MQFNHANFVVLDIESATAFFTTHFDFAVEGEPHPSFVILRGEGGFALNLMKPGKTETPTYPQNFHVGFFVGRAEIVRAKHDELVHAGYGPGDVQEFRRGGALTTTFYCRAPGGFLVEVASNGPI